MTEIEARDTLCGIVAAIELPHESDVIPGSYMAGSFGVEPVWLKLAEVDEYGRSECRAFVVDEKNALDLVDMAATYPDAFDYARYIGGSQIACLGSHLEMSEAIRCFSARVLCGQQRRPTKKGPLKSTWAMPRMYQYAMCRWVSAGTGLFLIRNDEKSNRRNSACDMVAEVLSEVGSKKMKVSYNQLKDLCYKPNFDHVRNLSERAWPTPVIRVG